MQNVTMPVPARCAGKMIAYQLGLEVAVRDLWGNVSVGFYGPGRYRLAAEYLSRKRAEIERYADQPWVMSS